MAAKDEERGERLEEEKEETWGTWEELLLVSAVNKHGLNNWDSVAIEIQNRITSSPHFILAPHDCKERYQHIRHRFSEGLRDESETDKEADTVDAKPCLEELRKLRVAELRREVEQYDVSIMSLQLKVQRLTEEREISLKDKQIGGDEPDLDGVRSETEKKENKIISGEDENQSFNESNSTDPKDENQRLTLVDESDKKSDQKEAVATEPDPISTDSNRAEEGSCNGSSETIAKDSVGQAFEKSPEPIRAGQPDELTELWESVAESKGGGEAELMKDNSDVQSSASLSKERRREKDVAVSSNGEEAEIDDASPAIKRISVKSQPMVKILEMIKSHKYGYVFEKRIKSQENFKYKNLIRQHMDLERINKRLKDGQYSGCRPKFFRDLLLLINNAIVFFPHNSVEFTAAVELRQIVSKEMSSRIRKASQSPEAQPPPTIILPFLPKTDKGPSEPLVVKPKTSVPLVVCRKRSSMSSKGGASVVGEKKVEKKEPVVEEKKLVDRKQQDNRVTSLLEELIVVKKGKRDGLTLGARSSRPIGKSQSNNISNKPPNLNTSRNPNSGSSSKCGVAIDENLEVEKEKKANVSNVSKRRSATNFLNRMKKNTSFNASLVEYLDNPENNPNSTRVELKKNNGGKGDGRKEPPTRTNSSRKKSEHNSPGKKSVGRPPKKNASSSPVTTPTPTPPPPLPSKRSRETIETEVMAPKKLLKRPRR